MDSELHVVRYAFDAAFQRICEAHADEDRMAELSNLLHHLYRLRELCARRLGTSFEAAGQRTSAHSGWAASWARNFDTPPALYVGFLAGCIQRSLHGGVRGISMEAPVFVASDVGSTGGISTMPLSLKTSPYSIRCTAPLTRWLGSCNSPDCYCR